MSDKHKDVEYGVGTTRPRPIFDNAADAALFAIMQSISRGVPEEIEILIYSEEGVRWYTRDKTIKWDEDPGDVFERIVVSAESHRT